MWNRTFHCTAMWLHIWVVNITQDTVPVLIVRKFSLRMNNGAGGVQGERSLCLGAVRELCQNAQYVLLTVVIIRVSVASRPPPEIFPGDHGSFPLREFRTQWSSAVAFWLLLLEPLHEDCWLSSCDPWSGHGKGEVFCLLVVLTCVGFSKSSVWSPFCV